MQLQYNNFIKKNLFYINEIKINLNTAYTWYHTLNEYQWSIKKVNITFERIHISLSKCIRIMIICFKYL